ncbi:MAG TPA: phosphomannomutase [Gammaproteobacteria bacterium]|nr:phosphomannomutase [Gammaproteobacteria bacterium]
MQSDDDIAARLARCFKAYDVRGRVPHDLDRDLARRIGRAFAAFLGAKRVVVGRDVRPSSPQLAEALAMGLRETGADVVDIGLCGTEEVYFATFDLGADGGVMVTASHNPRGWNGMKFVRGEARAVSEDSGLLDIRRLAADHDVPATGRYGTARTIDHRERFVEHLLTYVETAALRPLRIVTNAGNGGAGLVIDALQRHLPFEFVKVHHEPDGRFPNGVPNPLLPENRAATAEAVQACEADFGVAWDGDFDRCFLFDERGYFIESYYLVGLLAAHLLGQNPGGRIVHDPRLTWNTIEMVREAGGTPVQSRTGHAFLKERMWAEDAVYGGEMSAHHYFRDFRYCDSGMIPWLIIAELVSRQGTPLSEMVRERMKRFPVSGEINRVVDDPDKILREMEQCYARDALAIDHTDGLSMEFERWRFNLRKSNTEPLLRLNVETRGDADLLETVTRELLARIGGERP